MKENLDKILVGILLIKLKGKLLTCCKGVSLIVFITSII